MTKRRLQQKFLWLQQGCKPKTSSRRHQSSWKLLPAVTDSPRVETEATERNPANTPQQDSEEKATPIHVDLSSEERQLLELGPKFALTRRVDETLMSSVKVEIAACAYRLHWVEAKGLTLLKNLRSELHISVSDKGGEFVVMKRDDRRISRHITSIQQESISFSRQLGNKTEC